MNKFHFFVLAISLLGLFGEAYGQKFPALMPQTQKLLDIENMEVRFTPNPTGSVSYLHFDLVDNDPTTQLTGNYYIWVDLMLVHSGSGKDGDHVSFDVSGFVDCSMSETLFIECGAKADNSSIMDKDGCVVIIQGKCY